MAKIESLCTPLDFPDALCLLFVGLKLSGHIDWSWLWVSSPIWIHAVTIILTAKDKGDE